MRMNAQRHYWHLRLGRELTLEVLVERDRNVCHAIVSGDNLACGEDELPV
jgi:hypothetical protein